MNVTKTNMEKLYSTGLNPDALSESSETSKMEQQGPS